VCSFYWLALDVGLCLQQQLPVDKHARAQWWFPLAKMMCGSFAAASAQLAAYPLDTVRRRMQLNGAQVRSCSGAVIVHLHAHCQVHGLRSQWSTCMP
jgi:hypothetical protein